MNFKRILLIFIIVAVSSFLVAGLLYVFGGHELFKSQGNSNYITNNKTIEKEETIEDIGAIKVNMNVGNIDLKYTDQDVFKLELINPIKQSKNPIKIDRDQNILNININDVERNMNFHMNKGFNNMKNCKLTLSIPNTYKGNIDILSNVGNITGEYAGGELKLDADVGNIDLKINELESVKITTDIGNIKLKIKEESNLTVSLKTELGKVKNNLKNIKNLDDNNDSDFKIRQDMKFDVNKGGSLIDIKSDLGNIELYN